VAEAIGFAGEDVGLLHEADVGERHIFALLRVGGQDADWIADEEGVAAQAHPVEAEVREHVMRHVLFIDDRLA
jgi:hypothetical protein